MQLMPTQPVTEFAVPLNPLLQLLQRCAACMRLGPLLLHMLHFGQHIATLLFELRQLALL